jgi:hypothetical protein
MWAYLRSPRRTYESGKHFRGYFRSHLERFDGSLKPNKVAKMLRSCAPLFVLSPGIEIVV